MLYMSLYLKQHRDRYYELLQRVRTEGAWEEWIDFFVLGVSSTSEKAVTLAAQILELFTKDEAKLKQSGRTERVGAPGSATAAKDPIHLTGSTCPKDRIELQHCRIRDLGS